MILWLSASKSWQTAFDWQLRNPRNDVELTALMRRMWPESTGPAHSFEPNWLGLRFRSRISEGAMGWLQTPGAKMRRGHQANRLYQAARLAQP